MTEPWQYSDISLIHGLKVAKTGGRKNVDEGTTEEQRLIRLIRLIERDAFRAGQLSVRNLIKGALGIVP